MNMINPKGSYATSEQMALCTESPFFENRARDLDYLRILDCDRMLYNFRLAFGVDTLNAEPLGGWEEPDGLLRGHSTGHFLSALALAYSATGEDIFREKIDYMVSELQKLQNMCQGDPKDFETLCTPADADQSKWNKNPEVWGKGFLSAYSPDQFALLEKLTKYKEIWAPYYTLHKIVAGLLECYNRVGNKKALEIAEGIGCWMYERLSVLTEDRRKQMWSLYIAGEFGGMNESMAELYRITGKDIYLKTAKMFDNENVFPGLAEGKDVIQNLHANQHIPQILGAHKEYEVTGEAHYKKTAEEFFKIVTLHHMYAIGGVGQGESFRDADALAANIKENTNCETCAAYNLMKLARELYAYDPENAEYMDYYERAVINQILASQNPDNTPDALNGVTYMLPIGPGAVREYTDNYNSFTCCHGTGMENHVKYTDGSFFVSETQVYVNQYIPAVFKGDGYEIAVSWSFPFNKVQVTVKGDAVKIKLRIPKWSENPFDLPTEGRYAVLDHKGGTTNIEGCFTYGVRIEYTHDTLDNVKVGAIMYGPFVMVLQDSTTDWITLSEKEILALTPAKDGFGLLGGEKLFVPMYTAYSGGYHAYFKIV